MSKKNFADTVRGKVRRLRRAPDVALLIKHGVIDEEGDLRKEGRFLVAAKVFEGVTDVRKSIIDDLKELEAAEARASK